MHTSCRTHSPRDSIEPAATFSRRALSAESVRPHVDMKMHPMQRVVIGAQRRVEGAARAVVKAMEEHGIGRVAVPAREGDAPSAFEYEAAQINGIRARMLAARALFLIVDIAAREAPRRARSFARARRRFLPPPAAASDARTAPCRPRADTSRETARCTRHPIESREAHLLVRNRRASMNPRSAGMRCPAIQHRHAKRVVMRDAPQLDRRERSGRFAHVERGERIPFVRHRDAARIHRIAEGDQDQKRQSADACAHVHSEVRSGPHERA